MTQTPALPGMFIYYLFLVFFVKLMIQYQEKNNSP
jgi:hypothetical protein